MLVKSITKVVYNTDSHPSRSFYSNIRSYKQAKFLSGLLTRLITHLFCFALTMSSPVKLYVYDLSNGLARQLSLQLTGRQIDGIWYVLSAVHGSI